MVDGVRICQTGGKVPPRALRYSFPWTLAPRRYKVVSGMLHSGSISVMNAGWTVACPDERLRLPCSIVDARR